MRHRTLALFAALAISLGGAGLATAAPDPESDAPAPAASRQPADPGTIAGTVTLKGAPLAAKTISLTASAAQTAHIRAQGAGTITGKVLNAQGKASANLMVTAIATNRFGLASALTDENGCYTLSGLPAGTYQVTATSFIEGDDDGPGIDRGVASKSVKVATGRNSVARTIRLHAPLTGTSTITGKVTGDTSVYRGNNALTLVSKPFTMFGNIGPKGTVKVGHLPAGTYKVFLNGTNSYRTVKVAKGKSKSFGTMKRAKGTTISGTVKTTSHKAAKKVRVFIRDAAGTLLGSDKTNSKGRFSIPGATSGKYTITLITNGRRGLAPTPKTVKVSKGKKRTVNLTLRHSATIKGKVVDSYGKPVVGISVNALPVPSVSDDSVKWSDGTNSKGEYSITKVPAGTYKVMTIDWRLGGYYHAYYKGSTLKKSKTLKATAGKTLRLATITVK